MSIRISVLLAVIIITGCQAILDVSLNNVKRRFNLTCASNSPLWNDTGCELCIIEFFNNGSTTDQSSVIQQECALRSNSFRRTSQRCTGFTDTTDIGYGICSPLPYETFDIHILCICATDLCNTNLTTCRQSVSQQMSSDTGPPALLPSLYHNLTTPINCTQAFTLTDATCALETSPFFDIVLCQQYAVDTIVLCEYSGIVNDPFASTAAWSIDNYEYELDRIAADIEEYQQDANTNVYFNDTAGAFFVAFRTTNSDNQTGGTIDCYCAADNCNGNLTLCLTTMVSWPVSSKLIFDQV